MGSSGAMSAGSGDLAENCGPRCEDKATECGAPAELATSTCAALCGMDVTEEQAMCLESSGCADLAAVLGGGSICGIGQGGSGTSSGSTTSSTTSNPTTSTPGGTIGDPSDCGNPTVECEGTDVGCQFSLSGDSYSCLVSSSDSSSGVCTQPCDPDNDMCPEGSCTEVMNYLTGDSFYRCL